VELPDFDITREGESDIDGFLYKKFFGFIKNVSAKVVVNANDVILFLNTNAAVSSVSGHLS
jgi:hypothetical protein